MFHDFKKLKNYGLGLGLRKELWSQTLNFLDSNENQKLINWLEIIPENFIKRGGKGRESFLELIEKYKIQLIPHSVNLSIGSAGEAKSKVSLDKELLKSFAKLFKEIKAPWFSDHLSCTRIDACYFPELLPVPFIQESVEQISDNVKFLQDSFQIPFLIENPSYYTTLIEPEMPEHEFINRILEQSNCGLLLDINNVYVNATNHNYDPKEFLDELNLNRLVQVHIAGHHENYKAHLNDCELKVLDTHANKICQEVYGLFDYLLNKSSPKAVLLERDANFPDSFNEIVNELTDISNIMKQEGGIHG